MDYAHNFRLGSALPDYVKTLGQVSFLRHRRTTDGYGGVEWWSDNGWRIRAYDKDKEIWEKEKKRILEALGVLRSCSNCSKITCRFVLSNRLFGQAILGTDSTDQNSAQKN